MAKAISAELNLPVVALVGRPNVGKSTLFNALTRSRDALVSDWPGLTRDRHFGKVTSDEVSYWLVDTGGVFGESDVEQAPEILSGIETQLKAALNEADLVLWVLDARQGVTPSDHQLLQWLRRQTTPFLFLVNKVDGVSEAEVMAEFSSVGIQPILPISAVHRRGLGLLNETIADQLPEQLSQQVTQEASSESAGPEESSFDGRADNAEKAIRLVLLGRPNVGKSTLTNRLLGQERMLVSPVPGTTRDAITHAFSQRDQAFEIVDTAGLRRRGKVGEGVEKFSVIKSLQAMQVADVVLFMVDAREPLVDQDLTLFSMALEAGRACVFLVNKWDGLTEDEKQEVKNRLQFKLSFGDFVEVLFISALHGTGVGHIYEAVEKAYQSAHGRWSTGSLNDLLKQACDAHPPPMAGGRRIKLRYMHLKGQNPPHLLIHGNQTQQLPESYRRYLKNRFTDALGLVGVPLSISFRSSDNPFAGRKNKLTPRQVRKRKRLMKFHKKK